MALGCAFLFCTLWTVRMRIGILQRRSRRLMLPEAAP